MIPMRAYQRDDATTRNLRVENCNHVEQREIVFAQQCTQLLLELNLTLEFFVISQGIELMRVVRPAWLQSL